MLTVALAAGCAGGPSDSTQQPFKPLAAPADGRQLFGVHLDWVQDSPANYVSRSGVHPAQYGGFIDYPLTDAGKARLTNEAAQANATGADFLLTLEPWSGLPSVTEANARDLADTLAKLNQTGVRFYIRFAHEMNGGWYPWGQQPGAYVEAFRTVASAVHTLAPGNAMVWSPNYGGGYPFTGGSYVRSPGSADFTALDTDGDGELTMADDMYTPFYPGDEYVDWVGLTLYWFGYEWPWGDNEVPDPGIFQASIAGTYNGSEDQRAVPDFYTMFAEGHRKPMAISETAALYNAGKSSGAPEVGIKTGWMDQVLAGANATQFPRLKMINWFEYEKHEPDNGGLTDWRATYKEGTLAALRRHLDDPSGFVFAPTH